MPPEKITFAEGIVEVLVQLAPSFVVICIVFIIFSWIRVVVDSMSGRGM